MGIVRNAFNKASKRMLLRYLEQYYKDVLIEWVRLNDVQKPNIKPTTFLFWDRRLRAKLKSCEFLLIELGSELFKNVKKAPSIRKTLTIEGRGAIALDKQSSVHRKRKVG
ncbi:hypothetical protein [Mucilaginibacter defluvii]|uniref:Uncharacterized protein n=1 Tax=Mucilaginibacter defluvii TaxID=1196019 RepID=A0ABP9FST6_9SPHI